MSGCRYIIIPIEVAADSRLSDGEKLLYGHLWALSRKEGYCYANNEYLMAAQCVERTTIKRYIAGLKTAGYIRVETQGPKRKIFVPKGSENGPVEGQKWTGKGSENGPVEGQKWTGKGSENGPVEGPKWTGKGSENGPHIIVTNKSTENNTEEATRACAREAAAADAPVDNVPAPPPAADDHMTLPEACDLYRQSFAGKNHLQVAPMTVAKLSTLITAYTRSEMLAGFEAAANAGASSISYLEAAVAGKRADANTTARGKPLSRREEAKRRLAVWARGNWLREEIATGIWRLMADGTRDGMPSAETIVMTAVNYEEQLLKYQLTEDERERVRAAFEASRLKCQGWPQTREICEHLPPRRQQEALPEETARKTPMPLWTGFMAMKHNTSSSPEGEGFKTEKENEQP